MIRSILHLGHLLVSDDKHGQAVPVPDSSADAGRLFAVANISIEAAQDERYPVRIVASFFGTSSAPTRWRAVARAA
jgi:hypothetical protein